MIQTPVTLRAPGPGLERRMPYESPSSMSPLPAFIDTDLLYCDDNIDRLAQMPSESVDLIYLDPPFFSNRTYEVIWGDEAEVRSFEDRWEGGIQHYIDWMKLRMVELYRLLKPTGSLYLHCDPHASHYLKVMLDQIFGQAMFRNEVVWKRTTAHNGATRYGPVHDVIFFYTKTAEYVWNPLHQQYDPEYVRVKYRHTDAISGRRYRLSDMTGAGTRQGPSGGVWRGYDPSKVGRHWAVPNALPFAGEDAPANPQEALDRLDAAGLIYWPKKGNRPEFKRFLEDMPGVALQDVWTDIDPINARAKERLGYPTQKPRALLERIIASSSNDGDIVLDPFCGCGTSVSVARALKRHWIGIDISVTAMNVMTDRFAIEGQRPPRIENMPDTVERLRELHHFEFQNWVIKNINGSHSPRLTSDMGIDGYWWFTREPVQVKQSEHVGRNVVDNFETAIRRDGQKSGYIVAFSFTKGAYEEVARAKTDGLTLRLVTVKEVLLMKRRSVMSQRIGPQPAEGDIVPFKPRKPNEMPTAEDLIVSARKEAG